MVSMLLSCQPDRAAGDERGRNYVRTQLRSWGGPAFPEARGKTRVKSKSPYTTGGRGAKLVPSLMPGALYPSGALGTVLAMPDMELTQEVIDVSTRLIDASREGEVEGKDVAAEIDRSDIDLYYAFQEAKRQGALTMYFEGDMGLPSMIRRG